jgi:hypothetical protein
MARYIGGNAVPGGYYLNARRWTIIPVADPGAKLPGDASDTYLRIHWLAALLLAPVLGGLFVVFLPFIGFAMFFQWVFLKVTGKAAAGARDLAATVTPGWMPGEAHLTGRAVDPKHGEMPAGGAGETALHDVAEEIARKRADAEDKDKDG